MCNLNHKNLTQVDDTEVISFLLSTEIIPLCLRTMEMGSELSKTVECCLNAIFKYVSLFFPFYSSNWFVEIIISTKVAFGTLAWLSIDI